MPIISETKTHEGVEIINIQFEDGSFWSGLKSVYDEQQASLRLVTPPATIEPTQPDEADLTEGNN